MNDVPLMSHGKNWLDDVLGSRDRIPFTKLASNLEVHMATLHRWRQSGRLEGCFKVGGRWWATREGVTRMIERDTSAPATRPQPQPRRRAQAIDAAVRQCIEMGV
jgi:hypothetical protein